MELWGAVTDGAVDKVAVASAPGAVVDSGDGIGAVVLVGTADSPADKEGVKEEGADGTDNVDIVEEEGAGCEVGATAAVGLGAEIGGVGSRTVVWEVADVDGPAKGVAEMSESLALTSIGSWPLLGSAMAEAAEVRVFLAFLGSLGITLSTFRFP